MIDLTRTDTYKDGVVPDADVEMCLRVIRTVRNCCLGPAFFDADGAVVLSHAHAKLVELCELSNEGERHAESREAADAGGPKEPACPDPDQQAW